MVKNEITAHGMAGLFTDPTVKTIIEIGGQDSKLDFSAPGYSGGFCHEYGLCGGNRIFPDQQAYRLNISIGDFGAIALRPKYPVRIAGRCSVFAESDMIHKQQMGYPLRILSPDSVRLWSGIT